MWFQYILSKEKEIYSGPGSGGAVNRDDWRSGLNRGVTVDETY